MKHLEPWMWAELEMLLPSHAEDVAVDIGAHEGEWAVPLSQHYSRVWCFEAQARLAERFARIAPKNVEVVSQALSGKSEVRQFACYSDSAHFSGKFLERGIGTGRTDNRVSLSCMALDSWELENVGLVKVDVEGMEVDVLQGAAQTITMERPLLVIEVHTADNGVVLRELLRTWQYGVRVVRHPTYEPGSENAERHYWLIGVP